MSLKDLVYDNLRDQMRKGELNHGDSINMDQTSKNLGISKTPLREALIKLEAEGFVKIIPWSGVVVNSLSLKDFEESYDVIGALESTALLKAAPRFTEKHAEAMEKLNEDMHQSIDAHDFEAYYRKNIRFHDTYINLSGNKLLIHQIEILKKRLYDFSRPNDFIREWEDVSIGEHQTLVGFLKKRDFTAAAEFLRGIIWSFEKQKKFIIQYYGFEDNREREATPAACVPKIGKPTGP
jgi:DNA-binding GntR family transcriptional regulator